MEYKEIRKWVAKNIEQLKPLVKDIGTSIDLYKAYKDGIAHAVIYNCNQLTKLGGQAILEVLIEKEIDANKKKKFQEMRQFWIDKFDDIKRIVYDKEQDIFREFFP